MGAHLYALKSVRLADKFSGISHLHKPYVAVGYAVLAVDAHGGTGGGNERSPLLVRIDVPLHFAGFPFLPGTRRAGLVQLLLRWRWELNDK